jgi:hypothetical protein
MSPDADAVPFVIAVVAMFAIFMGVLGGVHIWSNRR